MPHQSLPGDALSALGGDLTLSISFAVAKELSDSADVQDLRTTEVVGICHTEGKLSGR